MEGARLIVVEAGSVDEGEAESTFLFVLVLEDQSVAGEDALDLCFHWDGHDGGGSVYVNVELEFEGCDGVWNTGWVEWILRCRG